MPLKKAVLLLAVLLLMAVELAGAEVVPALYYEQSIYTDEYGLNIYPDYPPLPGQTVTLRLRTFKPAQKATIYSDRELEIPLSYHDAHWWGSFTIPEDYQTGSHFFTVWVCYPPENLLPSTSWLDTLSQPNKVHDRWWSKSVVWYQVGRETKEEGRETKDVGSEEGEEVLPSLVVTGEAVRVVVASGEPDILSIKGSQTITFKNRILEGSREGYTEGSTQSREETLRVNVSGRTADIDIDATLFRSTALGVAQINPREEKISILLRRGSLEAYLGDFTADFDETEFSRLEKVLSGGRLRGDFGGWGFNALYSSPKGEAKFVRMYGNGTQGPYTLGGAPIVIDSERVYVDGILLHRGDDFTIDYQAGTITFISRVIDIKSVIQVYYDYSQNVYGHETSGLRSYWRPLPNLKIGATYLNDSDRLAGAQIIRDSMSLEAINPQSHYIVGADGSFVSEWLSVAGEGAYSIRNYDLLADNGTNEVSRAAKFSLSSSLGPFGITAQAKRVGANFKPIGDPDPKQDVTEFGGGLSFRPWSWLGAKGDYAYQKYTQDGVVYDNRYKSAKLQLTPERLPTLEYNFFEKKESNDPVTGNQIQRSITHNAVESNYTYGFLSATLKGSKEEWLQRSPSEEVTKYYRANAGLATVGIEKLTFASNVEIEERREPNGSRPHKRTYNLNISTTPSKNYFISSSLQVITDSALGDSSVVDLTCRAQPWEALKADLKYSMQSVQESFPVTAETVSKQSGSLSLDWRPFAALRLRYLYRPNFTLILRTQTLSYNNEQQQAEINFFPTQYTMLGCLYKLGKNFNVLKNDYPDYTVRERSEDTDSTLYTIKMAPIQILSTEFNYLIENGATASLVSTTEPYAYVPGKSRNQKFDAIAKTSLSESFSVDSRYSYQKSDQGSGESASNLTNTKSHALSLKGTWNLSDMWSFSITGAYSRTTDYLLSTLTYNLSPGFGFIFRYTDRLRVDFDYLHTQAFAGAETVKDNWLLRSKYSLSNYVNLNLRLEQEIGRNPDYKLHDFTGNIEISL